MKILCTQENLATGLFITSHISSKSINLPILNNILIQVEKNSIKFLSTNLEIGVSCNIRGKIEKEGTYTVQGKLLSDYINLLPKERVELELIEDKNTSSTYLKVQCNNSLTKIKGISASDFPLIPKIERKNPYTCDINELRNAISQVIFAVSLNEARPEISGVFVNFTENSLILAATDSFRLTERIISLKTNNSSQQGQKIIIPTRTLQELQRILNSIKDEAEIETTKNIEMYISENQILFCVGNIEITSRLIEGQYPDYKQIIPQKFSTTIEVSTQDLIKVIKTSSLFSRSGIYDVILNFSCEKGEIVILSSNAQVGENRSSITAKVTGKDNEIVLNHRYLLDGLQNIGSDEIIIEVIDGSSPCIIKPKDSSAYMYIIMPIKQ